jgi:hypothetical protein
VRQRRSFGRSVNPDDAGMVDVSGTGDLRNPGGKK